MKYSGVGGQAVMEGVMMRNQDKYAVAVRKSNQEIEVETFKYKGIVKNKSFKNIPVIRGVLSFVDSLYLGMNSLMYSSTFFDEEEDVKKDQKKNDKWMMVGTVALSIVCAIALFFVLPYIISFVFLKEMESQILIAFFEGMIRLLIFIAYIAIISFVPDIKRTFMYHGAEHKCINCIEHGLELNVENVKKSSKQHKRCGTSFLLIVMLISIFFFMFISVESPVFRLVIRLILIPVIAGVAYEFIRLAGRYDNCFVNFISIPGLWMQKLTTKEPDEDMIEVGIASVEAVFDWKKWQEEEL